ncbi:hypothetical protein NMG60_11018415 [Bertholletia excelsa]
MATSEEQRSVDDRGVEGVDGGDMAIVEGFDDHSTDEDSGADANANSGSSREGDGSVIGTGLGERLRRIPVDEGNEDLLLQQGNRGNVFMQFLRSLNLQVMGACRTDERLKPLLKLNVSGDIAEDRLLAHLSQHFEPFEVGILARCLCIPLVSIRAGKINKHGTLFFPTSTRGNLNVTLLATSDLSISFIEDDGHTEILSTLSTGSQCSAVTVEEIMADKSGQSFMINTPDGEVFYFWCSEKSELLGKELLRKLEEILKRKPSLAELTGISESRLDCFATHLRTFVDSLAVNNSTQARSIIAQLCKSAQPLPSASNPTCSRHFGSQSGQITPLYKDCLSPRSRPFKEGLSQTSMPNHCRNRKLPDASGVHLFSPNSGLESLGKFSAPPFLGSSASQLPSVGPSLLSPWYCWCPPIASTLQYPVTCPQLHASLTESLPLPPLASLLSVPTPPLNVADVPPIDIPPLLPKPLSKQIPMFTPLVCDPIVHVPVIDVCSSGPGYLLTTGPTMSIDMPSLCVKPLIPETESVVERGARETLRLLIGSSSQTNPQFLDVPSVLRNTEKQSVVAAGSPGLCLGCKDVGALMSSIFAGELASLPEKSAGGSLLDQLEKSGGPGGSCLDSEASQPNWREEMPD